MLLTVDIEAKIIGNKELFRDLRLTIGPKQKVAIIGRNGVGKTSLVRTIMEAMHTPKPATLLNGKIVLDTKLRINTYEQELDAGLLDLTLGKAIEQIYDSFELPVNAEEVMRVLGDYLFDPYNDREQPVRNLSGGQKARLQLIKLFANKPNLVILDEPTNHLDLPSIEELESALAQYKGALLYVSHDSYLSEHLGGEAIEITPL